MVVAGGDAENGSATSVGAWKSGGGGGGGGRGIRWSRDTQTPPTICEETTDVGICLNSA